MCTYNITLDDTLVKQVRPSFADDKALELWLQQQMEKLMMSLYQRNMTEDKAQPIEQVVPNVVLSLLGAGATSH